MAAKKEWFDRAFTTFTTLGELLGMDPRTAEAFARKFGLAIENTGRKDEIVTASVLDLMRRLEAPADKLNRQVADADNFRWRGYQEDTTCPRCDVLVACPGCGWNTPEQREQARKGRAGIKGGDTTPASGVYRYEDAVADGDEAGRWGGPRMLGQDYEQVLADDEDAEDRKRFDDDFLIGSLS